MQQNLSVPIAIIVAGALIAGALYFASRSATPSDGTSGTAKENLSKIPALSAQDHVLGNPDADIVIVEYTDLECPFCKQFHATMQQVMDEYGKDGKVAWVIRNFPLTQIHPNAPRLAEAAECVASVAGNDAYWNFLDEIIAVAPINTLFPMDQLSATALKSGADSASFEQCLASGTFQERIQNEFNDAVAAGGQGTPFSVLMIKGGTRVAIPGAYPLSDMRTIIETALSEPGA